MLDNMRQHAEEILQHAIQQHYGPFCASKGYFYATGRDSEDGEIYIDFAGTSNRDHGSILCRYKPLSAIAKIISIYGEDREKVILATAILLQGLHPQLGNALTDIFETSIFLTDAASRTMDLRERGAPKKDFRDEVSRFKYKIAASRKKQLDYMIRSCFPELEVDREKPGKPLDPDFEPAVETVKARLDAEGKKKATNEAIAEELHTDVRNLQRKIKRRRSIIS